MAAGSNVTIEIEANALPIIPGVLEIAARNKSGGMTTNKDHFASGIEFGRDVSEDRQDLVFDPQTSGGLLISVAAESADQSDGRTFKKPEFRPFLSESLEPTSGKTLGNRVNT